MLQQTQVATVIPYYKRFRSRFSTVQALAKADKSEVLDLWSGLGYYRRAHQLHDAARRVVTEYGGRFPDRVDDLMKLPGIGRYTAGAIASIAFDVRAPILDGNVKRVLSRLCAIRGPIDDEVTSRLWGVAEAMLPRQGCGEINQAMMELGATICTPRNPNCAACPINSICLANQNGLTESIPAAKTRKATTRMTLQCLACHSGESILFRRRPDSGLWAGMWELPSVESATAGKKLLTTVTPPELVNTTTKSKKLGEVVHQLTHRTVRLVVHQVACDKSPVKNGYRWFDVQRPPPLPMAFAKAFRLLCD